MRALMLCLVLSLALVFALCVLAGAGWVSYYRAAEQRDEYGDILRGYIGMTTCPPQCRPEAVILTVADPAQDFFLQPGAKCYQPIWPCACSCPKPDGATMFYHSETGP